jgi:hypothetical protein
MEIEMRRWAAVLAWLLWWIPISLSAATYTITTTGRQEATLDRAVAPGAIYEGQSKQVIVQGYVNDGIITTGKQQIAFEAIELDAKILVANAPARTNAEAALNAGIVPPTIADIPNQTHPIDSSPVIPILASDPDGKTLRVTATGLPPDMQLTSDPNTAVPQLTGTVTTAGTYPIEVHAYKFSDIFAVETFTLTVVTP